MPDKKKEDLRNPIDKFIKMFSAPKNAKKGTLRDAQIDDAEKRSLGMKKNKGGMVTRGGGAAKKGYKKGGKVRGAGIAQRGVRKAKMR